MDATWYTMVMCLIYLQFGDTPLHLAVENGHIEVVRLLLLSQVNVKIKNNVSTAISSLRANHVTLLDHHGAWSQT